jgi:hypothetical protein
MPSIIPVSAYSSSDSLTLWVTILAGFYKKKGNSD